MVSLLVFFVLCTGHANSARLVIVWCIVLWLACSQWHAAFWLACLPNIIFFHFSKVACTWLYETMYLPQQYQLESPTSSCHKKHPNDAVALLNGIPRLMIASIPRPPLEYLLPEKPLSWKAVCLLHGRSSLLSSMEQGPTMTAPQFSNYTCICNFHKSGQQRQSHFHTCAKKHIINLSLAQVHLTKNWCTNQPY